MKYPKQRRLDVLKKLIASNVAGSQEDILPMLAAEGINVTQATLSRDLKELKVAKMPDGLGNYHYVLPKTETARSQTVSDRVSSGLHIVSSIKSIEFSGQIGVIKTLPGYANMVASVIDTDLDRKIMGTVAGDDTVFMILRTETDTNSLLSDMENAIPGVSVRRI